LFTIFHVMCCYQPALGPFWKIGADFDYFIHSFLPTDRDQLGESTPQQVFNI
jgi:hypothetical protein